jgi:hypothetical protein
VRVEYWGRLAAHTAPSTEEVPVTRFGSLTVAVLLVAAACGDDAATTTTISETTTTVAETTTTVAETTTTVAETTTTAEATTTTAVAIVYTVTLDSMGRADMPPVLGSPGDPNGSGCVVPAGDVIPDGIWFGYVRTYAGGTIALDLACFFTGEASIAAKRADGVDDEFDEEGWYIRNQNPRTYDVPVMTGAEVWFIDRGNPAGLFPEPLPFASWPSPDSFLCSLPFDNCLVWLYINGGAATAIVEQFAP